MVIIRSSRPVGYLLPAEQNAEQLFADQIACGCRCGYYARGTTYNCVHPNHEGSRILKGVFCFEPEGEESTDGFCFLCEEVSALQNAGEGKSILELNGSSGDIVFPLLSENSENDDSKKQNKSIDDITIEFFRRDETTGYLTLCEKSFKKHEEIKVYNQEIAKYKLEKPKPTFDPEILITLKELTNQLQNIAKSHFDDLDERLWAALSTRIVVAFYLQSEKNVFEKVLPHHFYYAIFQNNV